MNNKHEDPVCTHQTPGQTKDQRGQEAPQHRRDEVLEAHMDVALLVLQSARTPKARRVAFDRMRRLHGQRSRAQIERMERERGLR